MDCVHHPGVGVNAYCQSCGKPLCNSCVTRGQNGQVFCQPCANSWQQYQQPAGMAQPGTPNPTAAAVLGLIPGVGAMYNGQFAKGLVHVAIFAVLVSLANHNDIFGFGIAAWVFYQVFEAYHVARARRNGLPIPDPLGLNEVGSWIHSGMGNQHTPPPVAPQQPIADAQQQAPFQQAPYHQAPPASGWQQVPHVPPPPPGWTSAGPIPPAPGTIPPPPIPPVPPPHLLRRPEPIGAIALIALGILFLLGKLDFFNGRMLEFTWPLALIALGAWLIIRRMSDGQGGPR